MDIQKIKRKKYKHELQKLIIKIQESIRIEPRRTTIKKKTNQNTINKMKITTYLSYY